MPRLTRLARPSCRGSTVPSTAAFQDAFSEAGVEILSPTYHAARDGNASTVPGGPAAGRETAGVPRGDRADLTTVPALEWLTPYASGSYRWAAGPFSVPSLCRPSS